MSVRLVERETEIIDKDKLVELNDETDRNPVFHFKDNGSFTF